MTEEIRKMLFFRKQLSFLITFTYLASGSFSLNCFLCSFFENNECPLNDTNIDIWSSNSSKYTYAGSDDDLACSIGLAQSGKIYIQSAVPKSLCETSGFKNALIIRINKVPEIGGRVICCTKSGCNWNGTTAEQDLSFAEITQKWYALVAVFGWTPVIIVSIVAGIILCCCCGLCIFLCCRKKKRREQPKEASKTDKKPQAQLNPYVNPRLNQKLDNAPKRIDIMELKSRDRQRYSAIDRKLFRPDTQHSPNYLQARNVVVHGEDPTTGYNKDRIGAISKDIFRNDDFREANHVILDAKSKQPENKDWVNVWKSSTDPSANAKPNVAKGSLTNAFRFKN